MRKLYFIFSAIVMLNSCSGNSDEITENTATASPSSKMKGVYIAGSENDQACYWKDNEKVVLTDGNNYLATKVFVDDNHTYVISMHTPDSKPYIWVDNVKKKINDYYNLPASNDVYFMNAYLDHNDFYLLGIIYNPNEPTADKYEVCYWKNGVKTSLTKVSSTQKIAAKNLTVSQNNVYVAVRFREQYTGNVLDNGYYKNGQYISLNKAGYYLEGVFGNDDNLKLMYRNDVACTINSVDLLNNTNQIHGISNPEKMFFNNGNIYVKGLSEVLKNNTKTYISYDGGVYYNITDFEVNKDGTDTYIIKQYAAANPSYSIMYKNNTEYKKMTPSLDKGYMFDIFIKD